MTADGQGSVISPQEWALLTEEKNAAIIRRRLKRACRAANFGEDHYRHDDIFADLYLTFLTRRLFLIDWDHQRVVVADDTILLQEIGRKQKVKWAQTREYLLPAPVGEDAALWDAAQPPLLNGGKQRGPHQRPKYVYADGSEVSDADWQRIEQRLLEREAFRFIATGTYDHRLPRYRDTDRLLPGELGNRPGCNCGGGHSTGVFGHRH